MSSAFPGPIGPCKDFEPDTARQPSFSKAQMPRVRQFAQKKNRCLVLDLFHPQRLGLGGQHMPSVRPMRRRQKASVLPGQQPGHVEGNASSFGAYEKEIWRPCGCRPTYLVCSVLFGAPSVWDAYLTKTPSSQQSATHEMCLQEIARPARRGDSKITARPALHQEADPKERDCQRQRL